MQTSPTLFLCFNTKIQSYHTSPSQIFPFTLEPKLEEKAEEKRLEAEAEEEEEEEEEERRIEKVK